MANDIARPSPGRHEMTRHWPQLAVVCSRLTGGSTCSRGAGHLEAANVTHGGQEFVRVRCDRGWASLRSRQGNQMLEKSDDVITVPEYQLTPSGMAAEVNVGVRTRQLMVEEMQVVCPAGCSSGDLIVVNKPDGQQLQVQVPEGVSAGQPFVVKLAAGGTSQELRTSRTAYQPSGRQRRAVRVAHNPSLRQGGVAQVLVDRVSGHRGRDRGGTGTGCVRRLEARDTGELPRGVGTVCNLTGWALCRPELQRLHG